MDKIKKNIKWILKIFNLFQNEQKTYGFGMPQGQENDRILFSFFSVNCPFKS